jgi:hypothetical protein
VAMDGEITRYLNPQTLYRILVDSLVVVPEEAEVTPEKAPDEST